MSLPPPLPDALQVITISSLSAALANLHADVSVEDIIKAVQDENEAHWQRAKLTTEATNRRAALAQRKSTPASHYTHFENKPPSRS